jgi:hypothetical protein
MQSRGSNKLKDQKRIAAAIEALFATEDLPLFAPLGADILSKVGVEMKRKGAKKRSNRSLKSGSKTTRKKQTGKAPRSR